MQKMTHDEFCKKIEVLYGGSITVLSKYVNKDTKISVKCNKCRI